MTTSNIESKMKDLVVKTDINILLLGGTGVGKSTLINSFANYLTYGDLKKAKKDKLMVLIPTQFNIKDKNGEYHIINTGEADQNEYLQTGESATQDVKTYVFPIWNGQTKLRLIDTPGMGDTRGIVQDDVNSENILSYIGNLHELHAICFLLKPNESRDTVFFKYCMNQIFSRLDKSASDNIIFCFTNTRGSDYTPGETVGILKKAVDEIGSRPPNAQIPLNRNIFCFDNEPFRYLTAVKKGLEFEPDIKERNKESWEKSAEQCWKLIHYITGDKDNRPLKPHHVKSTNAINEARRMINQLAQPLAEITQLIHTNMSVLDRHKDMLKHDNASLEEMRTKLFMPIVALEAITLTQPVTVCAARKCADVLTVAGKNAWHYKQRCHDPCFLTNVPKEVIGSPELLHCWAMRGSGTACHVCHCDFKVHMHVYYLTKLIEKEEKDENMQQNITTRQQGVKAKERVMRDIELRQRELNEEHQVIVDTCAKFAHFLQNNAITPFNDAYKEYIEYLINRERSLGRLCDAETIRHLEQLVLRYVEVKHRFDEALKSTKAIGRNEIITAKEITDSIQTLYKLKLHGKKIQELYSCQKKPRSKEFQTTEYVLKIPFKPKEDEKKDKKEKKDKDKSEKKDKKGKEYKDKDNKEKKSDDNRNRHQNRGNSRNETQRSRPVTPPPSYQEAHRGPRPQNVRPPNQGGYAPTQGGYPPNQGGYPPNQGGYPNYPYTNQGGPPYAGHYPYGPHPGDGQYPPQGPYRPQAGPYQFGQDYKGPSLDDDHREYDINISLKKVGEPTVSPASRRNYQNLPPNPNPPHYDYNHPSPSYNHPSTYYGQPPYPPPLMGQPHNAGQSYDYRHGVNRHNSGGNYQGPRTYEQGRGDFNRDNRGRGGGGGGGAGGIQKRNRGKKGKGANDNEKQKPKNEKSKSKKEKKVSNDSDSSDSSSD